MKCRAEATKSASLCGILITSSVTAKEAADKQKSTFFLSLSCCKEKPWHVIFSFSQIFFSCLSFDILKIRINLTAHFLYHSLFAAFLALYWHKIKWFRTWLPQVAQSDNCIFERLNLLDLNLFFLSGCQGEDGESGNIWIKVFCFKAATPGKIISQNLIILCGSRAVIGQLYHVSIITWDNSNKN